MDFNDWGGDYKIRRLISKGSFGDIYEAETKSGETVSVKRISLFDNTKPNNLDVELKDQALKEARNLQAMKHTNILKAIGETCYFQKEHMGEPFVVIVTEYCENGDLYKYIEDHRAKDKEIPRKRIMKWLIQISSAVAHLHNANLIHRDITPRNIFLKGNYEQTKLGDFGLVKCVTNSKLSFKNGTLCYQAPEVISTPNFKNPKSDCWSVGCIIYEMLHLKKVIDSKSLDDMITAIKTQEIPPVQQDEYQRLYEKIMDRNVDKRIDSSEINKELESIKNTVVLHKDNLLAYKEDRDAFKFKFNKLKLIEKNAFEGSDDLTNLDLSQNKLTLKEEKDIFSGLVNLTELKLNDNRIAALDDHLFACLEKLKVLWLQKNSISKLTDKIFANLLNLHTLFMNENQISEIQSNVIFSKLSNLENLSLRKNKLEFIPEGLFDNLDRLKDLNFGENGLKELPPTIFAKLEQLFVLKLDSNKLSSIDSLVFAESNKLDELDLSSNQISTLRVDQNPFATLSNLSKLSLSNNELGTLNLDWFAKLESLVELDVSKNKISAIDNGSSNEKLEKLESINLSDNQLTEIFKECWTKMPNLLSIKLDNNKISSISEDSFDALEELEELYLANNKFSITQIQAIFTKDHKINILNLSGNENLDTIKSDTFINKNSIIVESIYSKY